MRPRPTAPISNSLPQLLGGDRAEPGGAASGPARCRHCGASLKWDCPVCRRSHWVDEPKCGCGFPLALREPLVHHFVAAQHAFRCHDMDAAREHLEQVQKYAPHHVGARNGMAKIRQQETDIEYARMAWELALAGKRLVAAWRAWRPGGSWSIRPLPEVQEAWKEVQGPASGRGACGPGSQLERVDPPRPRSLYRKSLEIAADLPDALAGLRRCPPDAPAGLESRRRWETGSGSPGLHRRRMAWGRSPSRSSGSAAACPSIPPTERGSPRSQPASSRIVMSRRARPSATRCWQARGGRVTGRGRGRPGGLPARRPGSSGRAARGRDRTVVDTAPRRASRFGWSASAVLLPPSPRDGERIAATLDQALTAGLRAGPGVPLRNLRDLPARRRPAVCLAGSRGRGGSSARRSLPGCSPADAHRQAASPARLDGAIAGLGADSPHDPAPALSRGGPARVLPRPSSLEGEWIAPTGPDRALDADPPRWLLLLHAASGAWGHADCRSLCRAGPAARSHRPPCEQDARVRRRSPTPAACSCAGGGPREASSTRLVARQGRHPGPGRPGGDRHGRHP